MYCSNCGTQLGENGVCPNCAGAPVTPAPDTQKKENKLEKITKGSKTYAALITAAMVFPASLSVAIDLSFHWFDFWFGYVVGAILVAWVCVVLPALKITPPPVTAIICFITMMGYVFYIMSKFGCLEWLYSKALPLTILFIVFVSIDIMLVSYKKVNWLAVFSLMSFETAVYLVCVEATYKGGFDVLHWSPILACGFISVAAVFLAFAYIGKIHKEDK